MNKIIISFLSLVLLLPPCAIAARHSLHKGNPHLSLPRLVFKPNAGPGLAKTASSQTVPRMIQDSSIVYDFSNRTYVPGELITVTYSGSGHLVSLVQLVADDSIAQNIYGASWKTTYYTDPSGGIDSLLDQSYGDSGWTDYDEVHISPPISDAFLSIDGPQGAGFGLFCSSGAIYFHLSSLDGENWNVAAQTWARSGRDTITVAGPDTAVRIDQQWNPVSASYQTVYSDSFFMAGGAIVKAVETNFSDSMKYICIGAYDSAGNETQESQTSLAWDVGAGAWSYSSKLRYSQTYNDNGELTSSVDQDSSDGRWTPPDSCPKIIYRYAHDSSGGIVSRTDSTWYSNDYVSKEIHYFKYGAFSVGTIPGKFSNALHGRIAHIRQNGTVETGSPVSISVFDLSGRTICTLRADSQLSLWTWCKNHGVPVGKGVYAAKIRETNRSSLVWHQ
jgi:hypothetical protein